MWIRPTWAGGMKKSVSGGAAEARCCRIFVARSAFGIEATHTRILIEGTYDAPFGVLGRCFDHVIGKRIARASLQDLGDRLATFLGLRERVETK